MSELCTNEEWAAENGESVEWARAMWWCDCPKCVAYLDAEARVAGDVREMVAR